MTRSDGVLVVDKPAGWTSHDVVARVRRLAGTRRVGHAGTLDPMATGLLVLGIERGTRLLTFIVGCDKEYAATIRLGVSTVTDDAEGDITAVADPTGLSERALEEAIRGLTGAIQQVPSAVSAIKVDGQRAYARVRAGGHVQLTPRPVVVHRFNAGPPRRATVVGSGGTAYPVVDVDVHVEVSSGTYVRALARDLGAALGVGGHLTALRRTRVGAFDVSGAPTVADLTVRVESGLGIPMLSLAEAAQTVLPVRRLSPEQVTAVRHGRRIRTESPAGPQPVAALGPDGALVAVLDHSQAQARSLVVFAHEAS